MFVISHARKPIMTIEEFKSGLKKLGWKQSDFALSIGLSKVAVSNWLTGVNPLPLWAVNYLKLLIKVHDLAGEVLEPPTKSVKQAKKEPDAHSEE